MKMLERVIRCLDCQSRSRPLGFQSWIVNWFQIQRAFFQTFTPKTDSALPNSTQLRNAQCHWNYEYHITPKIEPGLNEGFSHVSGMFIVRARELA